MSSFWILSGAISCALCIIIGAFGAHGLKDILSEYGKDVYEKGNLYHFFHSIALIINGLLTEHFSHLNFNFSGYLFLLGIILFSFTLYALGPKETEPSNCNTVWIPNPILPGNG